MNNGMTNVELIEAACAAAKAEARSLFPQYKDFQVVGFEIQDDCCYVDVETSSGKVVVTTHPIEDLRSTDSKWLTTRSYSYDIELRVVEDGQAVDVLHEGRVVMMYDRDGLTLVAPNSSPFTVSSRQRLRRECQELLAAYRKRAAEKADVTAGTNLDLFA